MKKKFVSVFTFAVIIILSAAALMGCGNANFGKGEKYSAFEIKGVEIVQHNKLSYDIFVSLDKSDYSDIKIYFTRYDKLKETDTAVTAEVVDGRYKFNVNNGSDDYFIHVKTNGLYGVMPITLPKMTPFVKVNTDSPDNVFAEVDFSIDGATSWSSFIDPKGKSVYRSANKVFDSTAELVDTVRIEQTTPVLDFGYSIDKPYYFAVFSGKNNKMRFVSYGFTTQEKLFSTMTAEIVSDGEPIRPRLKVTAEFSSDNLNRDYNLLIRSGADEMRVKGSVEGSMVSFDFPLLNLKIADVWYDVLLEGELLGEYVNLNSSQADMSTATTYQDREFLFAEWYGDLKVYFKNI